MNPLGSNTDHGKCPYQHPVSTKVKAHTDTEEGPERLKHLDGNVCFCLSYLITINSPKTTEKNIADDETVRSNIKLLTNSPNRLSVNLLGLLLEFFTTYAQPPFTTGVVKHINYLIDTLKV